jgi:hypothetical protein
MGVVKRKARERIVPLEASPLAVPSPALGRPVLGYARVETALAQVYQAEHVQKTAFRGRLKHFRKLGIPQHNPGKGGRIQYGMQDVWQLMVCLELAEFGIDPNLIVKIVRQHWAVRGHFPQAISNAYRLRDSGNDLLVAVHANFMSWTWGEKLTQSEAGIFYQSGKLDPVLVRSFKESDHAAFLKAMRESGERAFVFNLGARIRAVEKALGQA